MSAPTPAQRRAAAPAVSVWVTANAGTGKTRVLSDRVLRLLLAGAKPEAILCLTFTKVAAAEMTARIEQRLANWAVSREAGKLAADLEELTGEQPTPQLLRRARELFAQVLDLPQGLSIMTVHSLCQTLLRRFPLEAGVAPHFETIDDRTARELKMEARQLVLGEQAPNDPALQKAIDVLAVTLEETSLTKAIDELLDQRHRLQRCFRQHDPSGGCAALLAKIEGLLEVESGVEPAQLHARACADGMFDVEALLAAANRLASSKAKGDQALSTAILRWLNATPTQRLELLEDHRKVFLTKEGQGRKRLCSQAHLDEFGAVLAKEQARMLRLHDSVEALGHNRRTAALLRLGHAVIDTYERLKGDGALLDFDDLIEVTRRLLADPARKGWVLYKLDERLEHVLVDEAQDTSPSHWEIVEQLTDDFFAGAGAKDAVRTLFVVGDEKQSIYSFQGADLANFRAAREKLRARAVAAARHFAEEALDVSFRSCRAVLELVDAVLARPELLGGVVREGEFVRHATSRANAPGLVEIWPLAEPEEPSAEVLDWPLPDRPRSTDAPERRIAEGIAIRIEAWLRDGEPIEEAGASRPLRAGDILVLLARRGTLQEAVIRALKRKGIPVAGADRILLNEHIAVRDLVALGRAALLPEDDLNLACLLKSPLLGLDEDKLFNLAHGRGEATLLERLRGLAGSDPVLTEAEARLTGWLRRADFMPPFEFFAHVLGADGGRERLLARLGADAAEPIEAFLGQALAYERGHPSSLEGFIHWLELAQESLKRDPEQARDAVRVMTVHGAKGLEAPVVILADAGPRGSAPLDRLIWHEAELPLWRHASSPACKAAIAAEEQRLREEQQRLLYVALTRARDRLYVTGSQTRKPPREADPSWHTVLRQALIECPDVERFDIVLGHRYAGEGLRLRRGAPFVVGPTQPQPPTPDMILPSWARRPAAEERVERPRAPSKLVALDAAEMTGPGAGLGSAQRGILVHHLLQLLPGLPEERRAAAGRRLLANRMPDLPAEAAATILAETLAVLGHSDFAPIFGPGSRAEQPICGEVDGIAYAGQVDRLLITPAEILVVDYKSGSEPPAGLAATPVAYLRQMAAYVALLRQAYPMHAVRAGLLWTAGPRLDPLPEAVLLRHAPGSQLPAA